MTLDEARDADFAEWREAMFQWQRDCKQHFSLRDHFAAAALTGFTNQLRYGSVFNLTLTAKQCYELADAMLRERVASAEKQSDVRDSRIANDCLLACDEREAIKAMASYFSTKGNLRMQGWASLLHVLLKRVSV